MVEVIFAGVFFGLLALMMIECMKLARMAVQWTKLSPVRAAAVGGSVLALLALLLGREYLGL